MRLPTISPGVANALRIGITGASLLLAFAGFLQAYPAPHGVRSAQDYVEIFYKAIQLVLGQFPADLDRHRLPAALQISRFALPLSAAWATLSIGWLQVRNRARALMIRQKGDQLIVAGEGVLAEGLISGERARRGNVIAWVEHGGGRVAREAEASAGAYVEGAANPTDLKPLGLETARAFVAASDSDAVNMDLAKRVLDYAVEKRKLGDPLQILARIDDISLQSALEARLSLQDRRQRVELRLASVPQLSARQFLLENPLDRLMSRPGAPVRLCLIGWSPLAEMILVRALASAHFNHQIRLEVVIADRDADRAEAAFRSRRPAADQIANIQFATLKDDAPSLIADWVLAHHAETPINTICITTEDASDALSTGLAIETAFERRKLILPPLYVHSAETGVTSDSLVDDTLMQPFGALQALADPEALLQERHDEIARSIHDFYLEGRLGEGMAIGDRPTLAEWGDLPESVREENRLVADCYHFKLRSISASILEGEGPPLRFNGDEVELLAEAEHRRWMAAKLLTGWTHNAVRDDAARLHPDLVPYSELSATIKDLDREQVRMIPRILSLVGRRAVRNLVVAFIPGSRESVEASMVQGALDKITAAFPDRRIILRGELDDPLERRLLLLAAGLGFPVEVVIRKPLASIVRSMPSINRSRVVALVRGAYALHACPEPGEAPPPPDLTADLEGQTQPSAPPYAAAPGLSA